MSIHFVSGKPGAGKSFYGLKLAFEELRFGDRPIVTNLPILVGELNKYYQEHYDDVHGWKRYKAPWFLSWLPFNFTSLLFWSLPVWLTQRVFPVATERIESIVKKPRRDNICGRIHLITDEEMSVFFTKRPGCEIEHVSNQEWKTGKRPDYSVVNDKGVLFILDEVHIAFNSRAWADTGAEVLYYLSQHRKLGDDVICITQSVANVDKQFRSVAQDFTYIRNLAKETFGHFRLPARFIRKTYSQPPSGDRSEPMEMGSFTLDIHGLARCYDTAKGVGIHGRAGADKSERKKGIHWLWFALGLPIVCYVIFHFAPRLLVRFTGVHPHVAKPVSQAKPVPTAVGVSVGGGISQPLQNVSQTNGIPGLTDVITNQIFCSGWFINAGCVTVFLTDGNTYYSDDGEVTAVTRRSVTVLGKEYKVQVGRSICNAVSETPLQYFQNVSEATQTQPPSDNVQVTVIGHQRPRQPYVSGFNKMPTASVNTY